MIYIHVYGNSLFPLINKTTLSFHNKYFNLRWLILIISLNNIHNPIFISVVLRFGRYQRECTIIFVFLFGSIRRFSYPGSTMYCTFRVARSSNKRQYICYIDLRGHVQVYLTFFFIQVVGHQPNSELWINQSFNIVVYCK